MSPYLNVNHFIEKQTTFTPAEFLTEASQYLCQKTVETKLSKEYFFFVLFDIFEQEIGIRAFI